MKTAGWAMRREVRGTPQWCGTPTDLAKGRMTMPSVGEIERFILEDNNGEYYLISRDMLEKAKVTGQQKQEVANLVHGSGHEVSGYILAAQSVPFFQTPLSFRGACACSFAGCQTRPV